MADTSIASTSSPTKIEASESVKNETQTGRPKTSHPTTAIMVNSAIKSLKDRGGSSLQAIKKYISVTYKVDAEKLAPFIRKYIKNSVVAGILIQTKGKGASGSFKLAAESTTKKVVKPEKKEIEKELVKSKVQKKKVARKIKISAPKAKKSAKPPTKIPKSPKPKELRAKRSAAKTAKN
ncbi:histone H1 [Carabus blaptoides fortunei]